MQLEEIKKSCKIITNEEKNGEELYFEQKPMYDIVKELKSNGYKWHNVKKCWYRKFDYTETTKKEQKNYLGVKVGDIFHFSWGYEQTNANYFQVIALKGTKQVVIKEIAYEITKTTGFDSYKVRPIKNSFLKNSQFILDNEKGAVKRVNGLQNGTLYINIDSFGFCSLWNGQDDLMTCYY